MPSKCLPFDTSFILGNRRKSLGPRSGEWGGCFSTVICLLARNSLTDGAPIFSRRHTKKHSDNNRRHSETVIDQKQHSYETLIRQSHTEVYVHCCHGKHTVEGSRTLLSDQTTSYSTVTARSKAWNVLARSNAEIVNSNTTQGMDVCMCVYSVFVLPCASDLMPGSFPGQRVLPTVLGQETNAKGNVSRMPYAPSASNRDGWTVGRTDG
jgi:hypothetical protein